MRKRDFLKNAMLTTGSLAFPQILRAQERPEIEKLVIGFGLDPVFAPHIIAMKKGWLRDSGFLDVTTKSFTSGALAGEALMTGDIQLWTPGNLPPISMAQTGVPVTVLGNNCNAAAADQLVARKDVNIRKPEDLYGIKIGLLAGSTASVMLFNIAQRYGLDEKKLQVVNLPPPEQFAGLNAGNIQALICWQPWGFNAVKAGGELIHSGTTSYFETNRGQAARVSSTRSLFVMNQQFVRKNPNAVQLLMASLVKGQKFVSDKANRSETVTLVATETKQDPALVDAIWDQYDFNPAIDQAYVEDMRTTALYLVVSGRTKEVQDPMSYTHTRPLSVIDPALVKVSGGMTL